MEPIVVSAFSCVNALGDGVSAILEKLNAQESGLRYCAFPGADLDTYVGAVPGIEEVKVDNGLGAFDCRNNRLAKFGLESGGFEEKVVQAREKYGANRIGVFMGTSTSGLHEAERAYLRADKRNGALPTDFNFRETFNTHSVARFVQLYLGLTGFSAVISTSCSSSSKVFAAARRMIQAGICDAALVGGVDSLCLSTLYGFSSLGLLSPLPCAPFDKDRTGISIGEAAGFVLLEKNNSRTAQTNIGFFGSGESSDGFHMTSPHPEGRGAILAIEKALKQANVSSEEIDYINLHGTGTIDNDEVEGKAIHAIFGGSVPCSSTKGWTGHTLGASGIVEAVILFLCIENDLVPSTINLKTPDPKLKIDTSLENRRKKLRRVMSNSFGFGGTNCCLVFGSLE